MEVKFIGSPGGYIYHTKWWCACHLRGVGEKWQLTPVGYRSNPLARFRVRIQYDSRSIPKTLLAWTNMILQDESVSSRSEKYKVRARGFRGYMVTLWCWLQGADVLNWVFGQNSSKEATYRQAASVMEWRSAPVMLYTVQEIWSWRYSAHLRLKYLGHILAL